MKGRDLILIRIDCSFDPASWRLGTRFDSFFSENRGWMEWKEERFLPFSRKR